MRFFNINTNSCIFVNSKKSIIPLTIEALPAINEIESILEELSEAMKVSSIHVVPFDASEATVKNSTVITGNFKLNYK